MKKFLICICTYKRYEKLSELLKSINNINLKEEFNAEILIVDNYGIVE
ncbi:hypothetical protein A500_00085 [Clostridium sartagoforme AAU1]|uniref:Glycosyltransferase n=1 Tax=Clostridium sartagoforme AAU1 TaxID=1202534 RepID=R9CG52_9CLOT|nr:hypothetical protein [Clostridium sartagoforme]EOR28272.1 hypothetical protein A500_00085 [Clostridium sartagoforme AAU1]